MINGHFIYYNIVYFRKQVMNSTKTKKTEQSTWVGIDVAKKSYDAAVYLPLEAGEKPRAITQIPVKSFERTLEGLAAFHHWTFKIREEAGLPGGNMRIVMEATGRYSLELMDLLQQKMPFTNPVNPKVVSDYRKSLYQGNDTDAIAAAALARFGAERQPETATELPSEYRQLRELTRQRLKMVEMRTAANLRMTEIKDIDAIAEVQKTLIATLVQGIDKLDIAIKKCIEQSDELRENIAYATSIKGIGMITAATIFAECGRLEYYNSRQLGAYSGLAPFNHRSGTSINRSRISRKGPKRLRQALYTPMTCLLRYNPEMRAFRQRLIDKGKKPMQARCALMRKVLVLIRALVVNKTFYQADFHNI
jgi:transposase